MIREANHEVLSATLINAPIYVSLRFFGEVYYDDLQDQLPDAYAKLYVILAHVFSFGNSQRTQVLVDSPLRSEQFLLGGFALQCFTYMERPPDSVLADSAFCLDNPVALAPYTDLPPGVTKAGAPRARR
jgi:hypothetical protein